MDTRPPTVRSFIGAFYGHWGESMSGVFSVPFAAAAIHFGETQQGIIFGVMAFTALAWAAYRIWAIERNRVVALDKTEQREIVRAALGHLRNLGVGIRNEATNNALADEQWPEWVDRATAWNVQVIEAIRRVNAADAAWFEIADVMPSPRLDLRYREHVPPRETVRAYQLHDFRLVKLEQLISGEKGLICQ